MLKIGKKNGNIQIKETLDVGYADITSVCSWIGVAEKYKYDPIEAAKQIELFINSLSQIDNHNKVWYDEYKLNNPFITDK